MKNTRNHIFTMLAVCVIIALAAPASFAGTVEPEQQVQYGLGDIPLDAVTYESLLKDWPDSAADALPVSYDARNEGIVTVPKDQGYCGSCWAFASVGAFESHLMKEYSFCPIDLSEQQQNSCNTAMGGCCGGNLTAPEFWETQGPNYESCFPYGDYLTSCPTTSVVDCADGAGCEELDYRVINFHTVSSADFKTSCYEDGPSYWRFDVYSDFNTYWDTGSPGDVYVNTGGYRRGGHAVLIIGWDDTKGAYLCKNSWGATNGPNGDGTFWIAYSGHRYNLGFQMSNFNLSGPGWRYCFDGGGWRKEFNLVPGFRNWLVGEGSSAGCCRSGMIGWAGGGKYVLNWDISSDTSCVESVFYFGHVSDLSYNWINTGGGTGSGFMVPCATGQGSQDFETAAGSGILDTAGYYCFVDQFGFIYDFYFDNYYISGTCTTTSCGECPMVGAVEDGTFSWYVDIPSGTPGCTEGFIYVGSVSTKTGEWFNQSGLQGTFTLTPCTMGTEAAPITPSPSSR
jgi:hypothetical protein